MNNQTTSWNPSDEKPVIVGEGEEKWDGYGCGDGEI
jgi:hypothetical protein